MAPSSGTTVTLTLNLSPVPQNNEKLQESPCIFALTPRQVELIRNSRCAVPAPCPLLLRTRRAIRQAPGRPWTWHGGKGRSLSPAQGTRALSTFDPQP